jgi:nicotinate-nucleotide adenylyltransferase
LIGSDNLAKFHLWHDYQIMLEKYPFYVYPRVDFAFEPWYPGMVALADFPKMQVSSTQVRAALLNHASLDGLLEPTIIKYIQDNKLFV